MVPVGSKPILEHIINYYIKFGFKDFIIATGKQYTVKNFVERCFKYLDIKIKWSGSGVNEVARIVKYDQNKYPHFKKNIKVINNLFDKGFKIKLHTARYMGRSKENRAKAKIKSEQITTKQLNLWGVKFHKLIFGKPSYDVFVDDKAITFDKMWVKNLNKMIKKKK